MNRLLSFLEYRPRLRNILSFCFSLIVMLLIGVGKVTAQDLNNSTLDLVANIWMLIAGSLVFFLNGGFAMLETGFCRTNNATPLKSGSSVCVMQWTGVIRDGTLMYKGIWRFLSIVFYLERTNQLSLLPDKDLVNLCPPIEPYQVTKNLKS